LKTERFNFVLPGWLKEEAQAYSAELGISLSEYIKDAMKEKGVEKRRNEKNRIND
jgi:hypothetical protein